MSQPPLHLLCIEPRFPGRLGAVADWLVRKRGYRGEFYFHSAEPQEYWPSSVGRGLSLTPFNVGGVARESVVPWHRLLERGLCYAYGCWEVLNLRRPRPIDVVLGRSAGLGSTLFVPVYQPGVPIVNLMDYFYHAHAHDLAGEAGPETPFEYFHWRQAANAVDLLDLENGVTPWAVTAWQRELYPAEYRKDFVVRFDGVDTRLFRPRGSKPAEVAGRSLPPGTRVVTFVARSLDRVRGLDRFLDLANRLLRARSDVVCVVAGEPRVRRTLDVWFYDRDFRAHLLQQHPPHDPERLWFLDRPPQDGVAEVLAASDLHVYASRPYRVDRVLLEAMATGCTILAADSAPVREFLSDGQTGLLVPPADPDAWEQRARAALDAPAAHRPLGDAAAALVREAYAQEVTLPRLAEWLSRLAGS